MKWLFVVLTAVCFIGCASDCDYGERESRDRLCAQVQAETGCKDLNFIKAGRNWATLLVCGKRRYYEYGVWYEDCSWAWRERTGGSR